MTQLKHTPMEYCAPDNSGVYSIKRAHIKTNVGIIIMPNTGEASEQKAAFIVNACNSRDPLVAALELALEALEYSKPQSKYPEAIERHECAWLAVKNAIAKAGGK